MSVSGQREIEEVVDQSLSSWRFLLQLLAAFAGVALTLAALGLYGVVSLSVARQTRVIGIRMALGARAGEVGRAVVGQGLRLVLVGLVAALAAAVALGGLLRGLLFGVSPLDPVSFGGVAVLLLAVATIASWLPARRATRVSPTEAFRAE